MAVRVDSAFVFDGYAFDYADFAYNTTRLNERAIEVPIAEHFIGRQRGRGLEVGNVMWYYRDSIDWTVVDLYEESDGPHERIDLFEPKLVEARFDWVLSISTIEHVGTDAPHPWAKPIDAYAQLLDLAPHGMITVPIGVDEGLDKMIMSRRQGGHTFIRRGRGWIESHRPLWRRYGPWANAVWIKIW